MRVFRGAFGAETAPAHSFLTATQRPFIRVNVLIGRSRIGQPFLIDTGADYTIIQPEIVLPLLRSEGIELDGQSASDDVVLNGIGPTALRCRVQPAGIGLIDEDGEEFVMTNPILIPRGAVGPGISRAEGESPPCWDATYCATSSYDSATSQPTCHSRWKPSPYPRRADIRRCMASDGLACL